MLGIYLSEPIIVDYMYCSLYHITTQIPQQPKYLYINIRDLWFLVSGS